MRTAGQLLKGRFVAHLELHLRRAVRMTEDGNGGTQRARRRLLRIGRRHEGRLLSLFDLALAGDVTNCGKNLGSLVVVRLVTLDEGPAVDVNHHTTAVVTQEVKATHTLSESFHDVLSVRFLLWGQLGDESRLLSVGVALDETVDDRRLAGLGMRELGTDRVHLDVLGCHC